ncbi:MAG: hypothetical protein HQL41_08150, partial [Alphaproteobacteria bacterium]|nr:hypothetical protein [Alphaproteobacteria bacterium]
MRIAFQDSPPRPRPGAALVLGARPGGDRVPFPDDDGRLARALAELKPDAVLCLRGGQGWERVLLADIGGDPRAL